MTLARDTRGSATIPAIFFAAFLVACLGYLSGLGESIVVHETMRDAADATSLAPSVAAARAMNVLALLNLVMAAILAVLVAVKIVQLLLLAANVIACAMPVNPHCPLLSSWESPYGKFVRLTDRGVDKVNRGLHGAESALSRAAPLLGQARATTIAGAYRPIVSGGFAASLALVPGEQDERVSGDVGGVAGRGARASSGPRFGLPVEDERYEDLCLQASSEVKDVVFVPLKFLPGANVIVAPVVRYAGHLLSGLVHAFPSWFCGGSPMGFPSASAAFRELAKDGIAKVTQKICSEATSHSGPIPGAGEELDARSCESGVGGAFGSLASPSALGDGAGRTSKRVFGPASLGSDWFATYGIVTRALGEDDETLLRVGSWGRSAPRAEDAFERVALYTQISKSELYAEPRLGGPTVWAGSRGAPALADEAMLHPRWRARLRPTRMPTASAARLMGGAGIGAILRSIPAGVGAGRVRPSVALETLLLGDPATRNAWAARELGASAPERGWFH